ncbi:MAG: Nif3-like dinuclear metal center hexameric protein, partial [Novipirellula sp. JB048]
MHPVSKFSVDQVCQTLAELAPLRLAESWDNVGLLVGDRQATVARLMTCLTITPAVVQEAIEEGVDLVVAHHPLPFKPLARLTTDT